MNSQEISCFYGNKKFVTFWITFQSRTPPKQLWTAFVTNEKRYIITGL